MNPVYCLYVPVNVQVASLVHHLSLAACSLHGEGEEHMGGMCTLLRVTEWQQQNVAASYWAGVGTGKEILWIFFCLDCYMSVFPVACLLTTAARTMCLGIALGHHSFTALLWSLWLPWWHVLTTGNQYLPKPRRLLMLPLQPVRDPRSPRK